MKIVVGGGSGGGERCSDVTTADQIVEMAAHRVVVASRCEWFRRALMSGMKESIDRYQILLFQLCFQGIKIIIIIIIILIIKPF